MVGSAPLARGYQGIIPKAVFKMLILAVKLFIVIKQVNCKVILWKQLLVVVNTLWRIKSNNKIKENMLKRVMRSATVLLDATVTPAVKESKLLWMMYDNLHTWFISFKEFLLKFEFAMLDENKDLVFCLKCSAHCQRGQDGSLTQQE